MKRTTYLFILLSTTDIVSAMQQSSPPPTPQHPEASRTHSAANTQPAAASSSSSLSREHSSRNSNQSTAEPLPFFLKESMCCAQFSRNITPFSEDFCQHVIACSPSPLQRRVKLLTSNKKNLYLPKIMILHGPSGSGKTTLSHVIMQKMGTPYVAIKAGELGSEYANSRVAGLRRLIKGALECGHNIIIDEIDCVAKRTRNDEKEEDKTPEAFWQLLDEVYKSDNKILLIGTTNNIQGWPEPLQGRFANCLWEIPLLSATSHNFTILKNLMKKQNIESELALLRLSKKTQGLTHRDLENLTQEAGELAAERNENNPFITYEDLEEALNRIKSGRQQLGKISWNKKDVFTYTVQTIGALASISSIINAGFSIYNGRESLHLARLNYQLQQENSVANTQFQTQNLANQAQGLDYQERALNHQRIHTILAVAAGVVGIAAVGSGCTIS